MSLDITLAPVIELELELTDAAGNTLDIGFVPFYKGDKGDTGLPGSLTPAAVAASQAAVSAAAAANATSVHVDAVAAEVQTLHDQAVVSASTADAAQTDAGISAASAHDDAIAAATSATEADTSRAASQAAADAAELSETNAGTSAGTASGYAANAGVEAANAQNAATLASQWASLLGSTVDGTNYSARYWAQVAQNAANVNFPISIANGGTGQITRGAGMDAMAGAVTSGQFLRGDGTHVVMSGIQVGDVPILNQNTTGTASNVTGTVGFANGGTGQITQPAALTALLGSSTVPIANGGTGAATAAAARTALGLGSAATVATGTSGATIPILNVASSWGALQTFTQGLSSTTGAYSSTLSSQAGILTSAAGGADAFHTTGDKGGNFSDWSGVGAPALQMDCASTGAAHMMVRWTVQGTRHFAAIHGFNNAGGTPDVSISVAGGTRQFVFSGAAGGTITAAVITPTSDARVKTDIQVIDNAGAKIDQIDGVTWLRVDTGDEDMTRYGGVIAQTVETVMPDAIHVIDGLKHVDIMSVVGLLVAALKETRATVVTLQNEVASLLAANDSTSQAA